jgi:hypothetical protein
MEGTNLFDLASSEKRRGETTTVTARRLWKFKNLKVASDFWTPYDQGWVKKRFVQDKQYSLIFS